MENCACVKKNMENAGIRERISWCDVFKGIVIILVVVGHCTVRFNHWIYQFHMAAFFFVSGYTSQPKNKSVFGEIIKKFYRLMVPYYVINFVGITLFFLMDKADILNKVSTTVYPERFQDAMMGLRSNTVIYCDWLGAMWFLPVLFGASVLFTLMVKICKRKTVMLVLSVLVFMFSMNAISKNMQCGSKDLVGLAQFFLVVGYLCRDIRFRCHSLATYIVKAAAIAGVWKISLYLGFDFVVDWPSRKFNGWIDLLLPICGISLVLVLSKIISTLPRLEKLLMAIGRNSMGIMCFHFMGFKVAYLLLIAAGWMKSEDFYKLTPGVNTGFVWVGITVVSITVSIGLWKLLCRNRIVNIILGNGNIKKFSERLLKTGCIQRCKSALEVAAAAVQVQMQNNNMRKKLIAAVAGIVIISIGVKLLSYRGEIYVSFPYQRQQVALGEGWLPQSQVEDYRWIEQKAEFKSFLIDQTVLEIKGYIPENVTGVSQLAVQVNGEDVHSIAVSSNQIIDIQLDISDFMKKYGINKFTIIMDGARVPKDSDADQREFSALINSLKMY